MPITSLPLPAKKRMFSFVTRFSLILFWPYTGWLLLWNLFRIGSGESFWAVTYTNYFAPWLIIGLIPIAILTFIFRQRYLSLSSLVAALLILIRFIPLFFGNPTSAPIGPHLKVMTFNLNKSNTDIEGIISVIRDENPDVVALQELVPFTAERLIKGLESYYPFSTLRTPQPVNGQGLLSRYELQFVSNIPDYRYLSAIVNAPQGQIMVINVHAPKISPSNWKVDWQNQRDFIDDLFDQTSSINGPLLIVGDFNTTYLSENYALIRQEYRDAFEDSGFGFGFTYPAKNNSSDRLLWPLVRIDYIFYNEFVISHETRVFKGSGGSDHHPVASIVSY